jgi:PAS domain S-box-containing protein
LAGGVHKASNVQETQKGPVHRDHPLGSAPRRAFFGLPLAAALAAVGVALILIGWAEVETRSRQREIETLLAAQSGALVEALGHAVEHNLASAREIEELASSRLLDQARLLDRMEGAGLLDRASLDLLASELGLRRIMIFDRRLHRVMEGEAAQGGGDRVAETEIGALAPLAFGKADEIVLGTHKTNDGSGTRFAAAVRRSRGGAVLVTMDASEMLAFQGSLGASNLMDAVSRTGGVLYAVLEDADGSILAGKLPAEVRHPGPDWLELDRPVEIRHGRVGKLRLGLSTGAIRAAALAGRRRALVAGLIVFALAASTAGLVLARLHAAALRGETSRARSLTDAVLEGVGEAVIVVDAEGILRMVNPAACRLFGSREEELLGRPCTATPCAPVHDLLQRDGASREVMLQGAAGPVKVLALASTVRTADGAMIGVAVVLRDVTEQRRLEETARRTESLAAFGRLAASVAHEVRNPLNSIALGVQRLERDTTTAGGNEERRQLTTLLRSEIERLDGIVHRFLELALPPRVTPRPGDLGEALRGLASLLAEGMPPGVRLRTELVPLPDVLFDSGALRQVVHNLVRNGAEAIAGAGTVRIVTLRDGWFAILRVEDDGPGMTQADLERAFEFGFSTKPKGSGLGLPIVHRLVTEMGGGVTVDSRPGSGTRVSVRLPLAEREG